MPHRPVRSLAAAAVTTLALTALAACNDDDSGSAAESPSSSDASSPTSAATSASTSAPTDAGDGSPAGAPEVTVLDAGSDPHQQLLLDVTDGQTETSHITMTVGTQAQGIPPVQIPVTMSFVTTVEDVTDDQITVSFAYDDLSAQLPPGAPPSAQDQMDSMFAAFEEVSGTFEVTPSGAVTSTKFSLPDDAPPELSSMIDQLASQSTQFAVPFPSEPVGDGARWKVENSLELSGIAVDQTATYTLDSIDGDDYSISVRLDQDLDGSNAGAGLSGHTTVAGSYDGTLHSFAATSGRLSGGGSSTVDAGGQTLDVKTTLDLRITTDQ